MPLTKSKPSSRLSSSTFIRVCWRRWNRSKSVSTAGINHPCQRHLRYELFTLRFLSPYCHSEAGFIFETIVSASPLILRCVSLSRYAVGQYGEPGGGVVVLCDEGLPVCPLGCKM